MNKKGFTLIELLAVIVILAIIALIATPIVLNIIKDSRESSGLRSAEMYLKGVETSVATATLNNKKVSDGTYEIVSGDICLGKVEVVSEKRTCNGETLEVEMNGETPTSGTVTIESGKIKDITLNYSNGKTIVKNDGKIVYEGEEDTSGTTENTLTTICTHDKTNGVEEKKAGAEYKCKVKEQMETEYKDGYTFYVLTTPKEGDTTINLIMDQNINSDGTPAGMIGTTENGDNVYNLVAWISNSDYGCGSDGDYCASNVKGPVTAMQFLYNATKDWTNIDPVNYTYNDKTTQGTTNANTSYTSFVSTNGVATITALDEKTTTIIGSEATPLRARMPIYSSDTTITEVASKTDANAYLYDNLDSSATSKPYGYWTLSSNAASGALAYYVRCTGVVNGDSFLFYVNLNGVRPVITLKLQ